MSAKAVRIKQRVSSFADTIANKHQGHFAGLGEVMTEGVIRAYDTIYSLRGGIQWEVWIRRRISWVIIALVRWFTPSTTTMFTSRDSRRSTPLISILNFRPTSIFTQKTRVFAHKFENEIIWPNLNVNICYYPTQQTYCKLCPHPTTCSIQHAPRLIILLVAMRSCPVLSTISMVIWNVRAKIASHGTVAARLI